MKVESARNFNDMNTKMIGNFTDTSIEIIKTRNEFTKNLDDMKDDVKLLVVRANKNDKMLESIYPSIKIIL